MSLPRSRLVAEVYSYCGEPPDLPLGKGLPQNLVFQILTESEDEMLRDLDLSTQNRRVSKTDIQLQDGETEFSLNTTDFNAVAYLALQIDPASDVWLPVDKVNSDSLLQAGLDNRLAVSFRDTPPVIEVSWLPSSSHTLRVWYDRGANDAPQLSGTTELGGLYDSYLKLRTAAQCRELMGLEVGKVLSTRLDNSERQWERNVKISRQQGTVYKTRVFTPPRWGRPRAGDRTRFFIP